MSFHQLSTSRKVTDEINSAAGVALELPLSNDLTGCLPV
jgi:hypothetical protein